MPEETIADKDEKGEVEEKVIEKVVEKEVEEAEPKDPSLMTREEIDGLKNLKKEPDPKKEEESKKEDEKDKDDKDDGDEKVTLTKRELDKINKRLDDKDEFIEKLKTEKRVDAKVAREKLDAAQKKLNDEWGTDGDTARKNMAAVTKAEGELNDAERGEIRDTNEKYVLKHVPDFKDHVDKIAELLIEDNFDKEGVALFKKDPYVENPLVLVNLAKRAIIASVFDKEVEKNKELTNEVDKHKKRTSNVVDKIEKATNSSARLGAGSGGGSTELNDNEDDNANPANMTRDQLREFNKKKKD